MYKRSDGRIDSQTGVGGWLLDTQAWLYSIQQGMRIAPSLMSILAFPEILAARQMQSEIIQALYHVALSLSRHSRASSTIRNASN